MTIQQKCFICPGCGSPYEEYQSIVNGFPDPVCDTCDRHGWKEFMRDNYEDKNLSESLLDFLFDEYKRVARKRARRGA